MRSRRVHLHRRTTTALVAGLAGLLLTAGPARASQNTSTDAAPAATSSRVELGQAAPAFDLKASDGTRHSLTELRDKKNLLLVFFRGTW